MAERGGRRLIHGLVLCVAIVTAGCAARGPAQPPQGSPKRPGTIQGLASYYGTDFHGKVTASGMPFDMNAMVAAHPTLPFGTIVRVTNIENGRRVTVRIVDRGPAQSARADGVVIDLSYRAAAALGFVRQGRTRVRLDVLR